MKRDEANGGRNIGMTTHEDAISQIQSLVGDPRLVESRRLQIIRGAIKQFSRNGYHETTIKEIAKEAGVSPGLIYQYVSNKQDVLFLAIMNVVEENKREIPKALSSTDDPIGKFIAVVDAYTRVNHANRHAVMLTYRETHSLPKKYREVLKRMEIETNELIGSAVRECVDKGLFRPANVDLVTYHVVVSAHSWATKYWRFKDITTLDEYIATTTDLLLHGLLADKATGRAAKPKAKSASRARPRKQQ